MSCDDTINIIDNILPDLLFTRLHDQVTHTNTAWYCDTTAYSGDFPKNSNELKKDYSFSHSVFSRDKILSPPLFTLAELCCVMALDKSGEKYKNIFRIRLGLIIYSGQKNIHDPHVDFTEPHKTGLIYINENDGETIIFNEKYHRCDMTSYEYYNSILNRKVTVLQKVKPIKNRFCSFDGYHYHSSSTPTDVGRRFVMTFNYT